MRKLLVVLVCAVALLATATGSEAKIFISISDGTTTLDGRTLASKGGLTLNRTSLAPTGTADASPTAPLVSPPAGARISAPPTLAWKPVPKATYYNVQVMHNGKVLSTWPVEARLRMPDAWQFSGRDFRLERGVYRWYVWPGFGTRAEKDYGQLLGSSFFIVVEK